MKRWIIAWIDKYILRRKSVSVCLFSFGKYEYEWDYLQHFRRIGWFLR